MNDSLPTCRVLISTLTLRTDDGKAQIMVRKLTKHILQLKIDTINNNNINVRHLGGKGLHLNQSGSNLLSKNFVNAIQKFWKTKGCSDISNNSLVESEHPFRPESASLSRRSNTSLTAGFLENLRGKNKNRPIIAQLNINSLRNKFGFLSSRITEYVDILLLSETLTNIHMYCFRAKYNLKPVMYIVVIWFFPYPSFLFLFTFQCFSSVCFLYIFDVFCTPPHNQENHDSIKYLSNLTSVQDYYCVNWEKSLIR